jgi:hypothetical protein
MPPSYCARRCLVYWSLGPSAVGYRPSALGLRLQACRDPGAYGLEPCAVSLASQNLVLSCRFYGMKGCKLLKKAVLYCEQLTVRT